MDVKDYKDKKALHLVEVIEANEDGDGYAISSKTWKADTGEALPDTVDAISVTDIEARKVELQKEIASIDEIIKDCTAVQAITDTK